MPLIQKSLLDFAYEAEDAITKFMVVMEGTADGQCKAPTGASVVPLGVAQNAASAGESVDVRLQGVTTCIAQAAISRGALVAVQGTTGKVVSVTVGQTTGSHRIVGRALSAAAADGDQISILLAGGNGFVAV